MSYASASPSRSAYVDNRGGRSTGKRDHRDSDATLIEANEQARRGQNPRAGDEEPDYGYDDFGHPYYDYVSDADDNRDDCPCPFNHELKQEDVLDIARRRIKAQHEALKLKQKQEQDETRYFSESYTDARGTYSNHQNWPDHDDRDRQISQQRRRSVRFVEDDYEHKQASAAPSHYSQQGDVYSYAPDPRYSKAAKYEPQYEEYDNRRYSTVQDEGQYNNRRMSEASRSRHEHDDYADDSHTSPPKPVTAQQTAPGAIPVQYLPFMLPQKEKKVPFTKRIRKAFSELAVNPDDIILGCTPGRPTPKHLLDKEIEEEAVEEAKRQEGKDRRAETDRIIKNRKRGSSTRDYDDPSSRQSTQPQQKAQPQHQPQPKAQSQSQIQPQSRPPQRPREPSYDARLAEEYAKERILLAEYDEYCRRRAAMRAVAAEDHQRDLQQYADQQARYSQ